MKINKPDCMYTRANFYNGIPTAEGKRFTDVLTVKSKHKHRHDN